MKRISDTELKQLQLEILLKVDKFCNERNIMYFLSSGTLIGAIRHKGYIPWDDDIDIMLPRPDYERLIHEFNGCFSELVLAAPEIDWDYYAPYANIYDNRTLLLEGVNGHRNDKIGVKIDVFPIDGIPTENKEYDRDTTKILVMNQIMYSKRLLLRKAHNISIKDYLFFLIMKIVFLPVSYRFLQKKIHKIVTKYPFNESNNAYILIMDNRKRYVVSKKAFECQILWPFENHMLPVPVGYDEYLSVHYHNYMQLPPERDRIPHHGFDAYWL